MSSWGCSSCQLLNKSTRTECQACFTIHAEIERQDIIPNNKSFTWKLPSTTHRNKQSIYNGYVRQNYDGYIASDIRHLLLQFYSFDLFTVNDIKNAEHLKKFISPIFQIESQKLYLECWPNGCNKLNIGEIKLFVCFVSIPKNQSINTEYTISVKETNTTFSKMKIFKQDIFYSGWDENTLRLTEIQDLDTLTFDFQINSFTIHPSEPITIYPFIKSSPASYTWLIEDESEVIKMRNASKVYGFGSPIFELFGLKWFISIYPKGSTLSSSGNYYHFYLHLANFPRDAIEVYIHHTCSLGNYTERGISRHNIWIDGYNLTCLNDKRSTLLKMNRLYINVEIELIDIYQLNMLRTIGVPSDDQVNVTQEFVKQNDVSVLHSSSLEFIWKVLELSALQNDESLIEFTTFEMYGFNWILSMDKSGNVKLRLNRKVEELTSVVSVRCFISLIELDTRCVLRGHFVGWQSEIGWNDDKISLEAFKMLETCTIKLEMELVDIRKTDWEGI